MNLFTKDATYYANLIKQDKVTSVELVKRALNNIEALNPMLNAVTHVQKEYALKRAQVLDENKDKLHTLPPFYGVPTLLKDVGQQQAGFPATSGSQLLHQNIAETTDYFVERIIEAGFIIVGRSNVPEFAFKGISDSTYTGHVRTPFDLTRNAGGSSGGAAAALKAGIVPITMASDGGGSIRLPASFSGLIGLKPSRGRIIVGPNGYRRGHGNAVDFALTRSVRDTWTLLKTLEADQVEAPFNLPVLSEERLQSIDQPLKIAFSYTSPIGATVSKTSKDNITKAVRLLEALGHELIEVALNTDDEKLLRTYYKVTSIGAAEMFHKIEDSLERRLTMQDMEPMTWVMYKAGEKIPAYELSSILNFWDQYTVQREKFMVHYDLALTPITDGPAPKHEQFGYSTYEQEMEQAEHLSEQAIEELIMRIYKKGHDYMAYAFSQNIAGQPAISLPLFTTVDGYPIGTHFWSGKGKEYRLLQLAQQLEEAGYLQTDIERLDKSAENHN